MPASIFVFDPTAKDKLSQVRGIGRYLQILRENFTNEFNFVSKIENFKLKIENSIFINPFFTFLQPPLIIKRVAKKQIAVIHDLIPLKYPAHFPIGLKGKLNVFLNKLALINYDRIITDSEASKKDIVQMLHIDENKVKVIYPCLSNVFTNLKFKIRNLNSNLKLKISNYCIYVGDATWNKNLVNLARAIKIINITCVFVGKVFKNLTLDVGGLKLDNEAGSLKLEKNQTSNLKPQNPASSFQYQASNFSHPWQKELREFLQEIGNDKRFIFLGFIPDKELVKLYQQARVNILPSRDEGFGFSYLEAASQKCPTILSDIPVLHEIANDSAFFANPNDPHDIANKIGEVYFNQDLKNQLGEKAYKRSQFFSSTQFKKSFLELLQNL